jgi:hypothetical protein
MFRTAGLFVFVMPHPTRSLAIGSMGKRIFLAVQQAVSGTSPPRVALRGDTHLH